MYNPLISIVVPVYNRENTLRYCINSIIDQAYKNWELLLIDDGSTDKSAVICKDFQSRDSRIHYFFQENKGAGPARNKGIDNANGDWITFVDSDDAIMPNHLSQLQLYGEANDLVMVNHCKAKYVNGALVKSDVYWKNIDNIQLHGNANIINFLYKTLDPNHYYNYCCWDKFFKTDVVKNFKIKYPTDVPTGQDMMFVDNYFRYTENFYFSKEGTYAPIPMGNEGIEHLAVKLRHPNEYFHCHKRNYDMLIKLHKTSDCEAVKQYAINYILSETFQRCFIRYTALRNRKILGKNEVIRFMNDSFIPILSEIKDNLFCIENELYRKQFSAILDGKVSQVYNYWFRKMLLRDVYWMIKRRL